VGKRAPRTRTTGSRTPRQVAAYRELREAEAAMQTFASPAPLGTETPEWSPAQRVANRAALDRLKAAQAEVSAANADKDGAE
jgi:hypothetical protein